MSNPNRGGYAFNIASSGFTPDNPSIRRRTGQVDTRLASFGGGFVEYIKYYGNELTWEQLALAKLTWGEETKIKFPTLQEGWAYIYKCRDHVFTVSDDNDNIKYKIMTDDISKFGITWEIFTSHQFYLLYANPPGDPLFLIGWVRSKYKEKFDPDNPDNPDNPDYSKYQQALKAIDISAMRVDKYCSDEDFIIADTNLFISTEIPLDILVNELQQALYKPLNPPAIIRPCNPARSAIGTYDTFMLKRGNDISHGKANKKRIGNIVAEKYLTFLLAVVSASLYNRGKPTYEPWMLWWMWKWIGAASPISVIDKVFDIMPNWGA